MKYDVTVIGGGPSALSAALYLGRYKIKTLLVTESFGGLAAIAGKVENYPGIVDIDGFDLVLRMVEQVKALESVDIKEGESVIDLTQESDTFNVITKDNSYDSEVVLISTGKKPRKLGIDGEDGLVGKGLSYCATCDGPLSKGKEVIIIGGGRSATESALTLTNIASKITLVNLNDSLMGEKITLDKLNKLDTVKQINNATTKDFILEGGVIKGIKYEDKESGKISEVSAGMVFVEIGQIADSKPFTKLVETNKGGEIEVDLATNKTSKDGVFASGDITDIEFKQIIIAAGEGAKAAMSINRYLTSK